MTLIFYADGFLSILLLKYVLFVKSMHTVNISMEISSLHLTSDMFFLKDEEDGETTLPYRNSDPVIGSHTEKVSLKASDSMDSLYSGQSSSSKPTE